MKKEIFIIHESEIFRRGLHAVLRSYFNMEITQLQSLGKLASFMHISHAHLIIFSEIKGDEALNLISRLKEKNRVSVIQILQTPERTDTSSVTDECITLRSSGEGIREIISGLMNPGSGSVEGRSDNGELSVRERDVLQLVALGHSNKEIAEKLFISIHTVISHRKNITEKLGIKSISGLTVYAILNKVIDTDQINMEDLI